MKIKSIASVFLLLITASVLSAENGGVEFPAVAGWTFEQDSMVYDDQNLWDLINGAAEVFLAYGFIDLHLGEYRDSAGTDVRIEIYRHSSELTAFGMYAQERRPKYRFINCGTQGYSEPGVLNFVCGEFYVKMMTHRLDGVGSSALKMIAAETEKKLNRKKSFPALLKYFPLKEKIENAEMYIPDSFMGYSFFRSVFEAPYQGEGKYSLFIIPFKNVADLQNAAKKFSEAIKQKMTIAGGIITSATDPFNGEVIFTLFDNYILGAFRFEKKGEAEKALHQMASQQQ